MKKITTCLILIVVECLLIYLLFAMMLGEFDTAKWCEAYRGIAITLQLAFSAITAMGMFTNIYK